MNVLFFNDPVGTYFGETPEEEAESCREILEELVFENKKFQFESTMNPMDLENKKYDILLFDFGGMGMGASGMVASLSRQILKLIEDRPNTLFVAWSSFTTRFLEDECEDELGKHVNLIHRDVDTEQTIKKINKWISIGKIKG